MSNPSCISHLRISDADQIQIVVSKVSSGNGRITGTDITIQALNRDKRPSRTRKLPPLQIGEYAGDQQQLLSPGRVTSPPRSRSSSLSCRSVIPSPQPLSPNAPNAASRFHQGCFPSRPASPAPHSTTFPQLRGSGIPVLLASRSRSSSPGPRLMGLNVKTGCLGVGLALDLGDELSKNLDEIQALV